LKEVGKYQTTCGLDDVGEQFSAESLFLGPSTFREIEEDLIEPIEIDPGRVPDRIEVSGFLLCRHEAPVYPDVSATSIGQQIQRFG
jgi:hypothetical protein